jgi:electron transport complex protein RnfG
MTTNTQPQGHPQEAERGGVSMVVTMGGIGLLCGILIVGVFQATLPTITRKKAEALDRAILEVVPGATSKSVFKLDDGGLVATTLDDPADAKYYACYRDGKLAGVAVEAAGQGFQDIIRVIYGYSPDAGAVIGMKVLESKETPGLGTKIETDPAFRANFDALEVVVDPGSGAIAQPITLVKPGDKTQPWEVEAISGATISSRAIATLLRKSTEATVPVITENLQTLERGAP